MPMIDYLILVPMDEEFKVARQVWEKVGPNDQTNIDGFEYYRFRRKKGNREALIVMAPMGMMGLAWAALFSHQAIKVWNPANVIQIGIAGSLVGDALPLGDVIIPDHVVGYQIGDVVERDGKFEYDFRRRGAPAGLSLVAEARGLARDVNEYQSWQKNAFKASAIEDDECWRMKNPRAHIGEKDWLASGNFVVKSKQFAKEIRDIDDQVRAVEMEAMGLLDALRPIEHPPRALLIRGISDYADPDKAHQDKSTGGKFRRAAMRSATQFMFDLVDRRLRRNQSMAAAPLQFEARLAKGRRQNASLHGLTPAAVGERSIIYDPLLKVGDSMTELDIELTASGGAVAQVQAAMRQIWKAWSRQVRPEIEGGRWRWKIERLTEPYTLSLALVGDPTINFELRATDEFERQATLKIGPDQ